jgi:hypothetical protein
MTVVDRSGPLLKRRQPALQIVEANAGSEDIQIELAQQLDAARAGIARLQTRLSVETPRRARCGSAFGHRPRP